MDERLSAFHSEIVVLIGAHLLTFREFRACGAPDYFGEKDPIASRRWLADVSNAFRTSNCPDGANVRLASCLLKDRARDWWEEIGHALGGEVIDSMS